MEKSSHMTTLPPKKRELSEGFENVNFLKNDEKINKISKKLKQANIFFTG